VDGRYYYEWSGGRGRRRRDELPPPVYHALVNFLAVNGRLESIQPQDYVFQPVYGERAQRLPNVHDTPEANRPISGTMINAATTVAWSNMVSGTVYHILLPILIDGSTTSPNMSRGTVPPAPD